MALSGKYGNLDILKIAADEPVFILRAHDVLNGHPDVPVACSLSCMPAGQGIGQGNTVLPELAGIKEDAGLNRMVSMPSQRVYYDDIQ